MKFKRHKLSASSLGFSNLMLLAIAAAVLLSVRFTVVFGDNRKLPSDYEQIDAVIESTRQDLQHYSELEKLPKLEGSWRKASSTFALDGLKFEPFEGNNITEMGNSYTGPISNWPGQVSGDPQVVISSIRALQKEIPIYLYDYSISSGVMKLNIVVVGI
ncbi:TPA: hypothetical protein L4741_002475 [Pseudomonas aeruginosa]|nr:hypothetical protein [Pseudomonas aeruginosa]